MDAEVKKYALELTTKFERWLNDGDFMQDEIDKDFSFIKKEFQVLKQCINNEIPGAKFEIGEFVYDCKFTKGKKRDTEIVQIADRSYTENRKWVYGINYRKIDKETSEITGGGSSYWWDESDFEKMDDPLLLLIIKKHQLDSKKRKHQHELKQIDSQLDMIRYSLNVVKGNES